VRFVGDPRTRIREDYLRILRLFRFHAWYGKGELDGDAFAAAADEKSGLKLLSGERVQKELLRLLEAKNPMPSLTAMQRASILAEILPGGLQLERTARLVEIEMANRRQPDNLLRLAALLPDDAKLARKLSGALKFSNADRDRLIEAAELDSRVEGTLSPREARKLLYRLGQQCFRDQLLLRWSDAPRDPDDSRWGKLLKFAESWKKPSFLLMAVMSWQRHRRRTEDRHDPVRSGAGMDRGRFRTRSPRSSQASQETINQPRK
jgi:poly(A) polymerase